MSKTSVPKFLQLVRGLFIITDPGRDLDDEDTLVVLNRMVRFKLLEVLGVVANLKPSPMRARLARGTLDILGHEDIPVGIGSGTEQMDDDKFAYEFQAGYIAPDNSRTENGAELIRRTLEAAGPSGVILTLISQLTDAAQVLREDPELFARKVRRVVIMGGIVTDGEQPKLDEHGRLIPDPSAQNHKFDLKATEELYRTLQDRGIPLTIVSRHAAGAGKVSGAVYDEMAATGHPIGIRLRNIQHAAIQHLWCRVNMPVDDPQRENLPERCDRAWFSKTFCGGLAIDRSGDDSIADLVESYTLYDPCTLIAAMPGLREFFYAPYVHEYNGVENFVIGLTAGTHNVAQPTELSRYLEKVLVESLMLSLETKAA